jgi:hypothetical protein
MLLLLLACADSADSGADKDPIDSPHTLDSDTGADTGTPDDTGDSPVDSAETGGDTGETADTGEPTDTTETAETGDSEDGGEPDAREGVTFSIPLAGASITEPAGVGSIFATYIADIALLTAATDIGGGDITLLSGWSLEGSRPPAQDPCAPTWSATGDFSSDPSFAVSGGETTLSVSGIAASLSDVELGGTWSSDGSTLLDVRLSGLLDTRDLDSLFGGEEGAICDLMSSFGAVCEACPDGEDFCLQFTFEDMTGFQESFTLVEVSSGC